MSKIFVTMVSLELTQMCNLHCAHCLKGDPTSTKISREVLEKFFDEVKFVGVLYLTGGEVFLAYDEIKLLLKVLKEKKVTVNECSLLTNGTVYDERIYKLLDEYFGDNYSVAISSDDYHNKSIKRKYRYLISSERNKVYDNIKIHFNHPKCTGFKDAESVLFNMGRARDLDVPKVSFEAVGYYYDYYEFVMLAGPIVFLSADGYVSDGNLEINLFDEMSLGNILRSNLTDMLENGAIKIDTDSPSDFSHRMDDRLHEFFIRKGDALTFQNHKIVKTNRDSLEDYYEEIKRSAKLIDEIVKAESISPGSGIKIALNYDFDLYPHDISQVDHSRS